MVRHTQKIGWGGSDILVWRVKKGLKISSNCSSVLVPILNEIVAKNRKIMLFHKRADKRLADILKGLAFTTWAVLKTDDELILAQNENRPPSLRSFMGQTVDCVTLIGRAHK